MGRSVHGEKDDYSSDDDGCGDDDGGGDDSGGDDSNGNNDVVDVGDNKNDLDGDWLVLGLVVPSLDLRCSCNKITLKD